MGLRYVSGLTTTIVNMTCIEVVIDHDPNMSPVLKLYRLIFYALYHP